MNINLEERRRKSREYYFKNREKILKQTKKNNKIRRNNLILEMRTREIDRLYHKEKRFLNKESIKIKNYEYIKKYPEKIKASANLRYKIKIGKIKRGKCELKDEFCSKGIIQGHHTDYSKQLEVVWLCSSHHKKVDLGLIKLKK